MRDDKEDMDTEQELPDNHPGMEDGNVDANGEKVVHELDGDENLVGWHKEAAE